MPIGKIGATVANAATANDIGVDPATVELDPPGTGESWQMVCELG